MSNIAYVDDCAWHTNPNNARDIELNWEIINWTEENLWTVAKEAQSYMCTQRGFTESTLKSFHIGYYPFACPHIHGITQVDTDLEPREPLRGRVTIPVFDVHGVPISLVGRKMPSSKSRAKMLPIPYIKSNHLFGLNMAKDSIISKGFVFVQEGELDVLTFWQEGIHNVVCTKGTGISFRQLCLLRRYTNAIIYVKDNDDAGNMSVAQVNESLRMLRTKSETLDNGFIVETESVPVGYKDSNDVLTLAPATVRTEYFDYMRSISIA